MAIKIHWRGAILEVPSGEFSNVMRQLVELDSTLSQKVPTQQQLLPPPDTTVLEERVAPTPEEIKARFNRSAPFNVDSKRAEAFLSTIKNHTSHGGANAGQIAHALGIKHPKGVGSRASIVNRVIERLGYAVEDVYRNPRDTTGTRHWVAGPKLDDALKAVSLEVYGL